VRLLLVGCGGVGAVIAKTLAKRQETTKWLEALIIADFDSTKVETLLPKLEKYPLETKGITLNGQDVEAVVEAIKSHKCDALFDASPPFLANPLFDAAEEAGVNFLNMGTWSVPKGDIQSPASAKDVYDEFMTSYHFKNTALWEQNNRTAIICVGIDPGVVNVFSKYAAKHLFDELHEIHVKDGCNIGRKDGADEIAFGFNVWTVLDECLNPSVTWSKEEGFIAHPAFSGQEIFQFPEGLGGQKLYQIEHEEVVLMPMFLESYGLKKCSYKIALDDGLVNALKTMDALGLRSLETVEYQGMDIRPRDIIAKVLPQPGEIDDRYEGKMCVGVHCKGIKDGLEREVFLYQTYDQEEAWQKYASQAIVAQTAVGASIVVELMGTGQWTKAGVFGPEAFEPEPFMKLMTAYDYANDMIEMPSPYQKRKDKKALSLMT
jgi:saccharopine dehydrogenase-like NADP-dependent oxidoreductase